MAKTKKIKPGLGKGIGALIPSVEFDKEKGYSIAKLPNEELGIIALLKLSDIKTNPFQPRSDFDRDALNELKNSILKHGVIQPITVRKHDEGYELVSGERRVRASIEAGLETIPAYVIDVDTNANLLELAIIENVQREDLNPMEISYGYHRLMEECGYTQEQVAERVGKERSTVTNFLRLMRLPEKLQESLRSQEISMGHAKALLALENHLRMIQVGKEIFEKKLSVRATEQLVRHLIEGRNKKQSVKNKKPELSPETRAVIDHTQSILRNTFGTQVKITPKSKQSGVIEFEFYSNEDLERLIELFERAGEK